MSCTVTETLNGEWELTLVHDIDEFGKWKRLGEGRILRAPVPAAMTPRVNQVQAQPSGGAMIYRVSTRRDPLRLRSGTGTKYRILGKYKKGTQVVVLEKTTADWYEVSCPDGKRGYMAAQYLTCVRTESAPENAVSEVIEPKMLRDQPFRIYRVVPELDKITVYAQHIFYDLLDNMIQSLNVFGYRFDTEHNYIIEPTEAATVHRIFDLYETGRYSMNAIAQKMLEEKRASANSMKWDASHIHVILNNEKYIGDVLMQKKYTVDHMTHREVKNNNRTLPQFYVRNHHIPIIERKQYERCQKIAWLKSLRGKSDQYPYDDLLVCPVCGKRMQKHGMTANIGHTAWQCDREDGCRQYTVIGKYVDAAVLDAYKQIDPGQVNKLTTDRNADAAKALLGMKKKRPVFHNVDFWWLDELVERITFGKNYSVTVHWKCGLQTSGQMAITNHKHDPVYLADRNRNAETRNQNELNFLELASELLTQSDTMEEAIAGIRKASRKVTDCISTR